MDDGEFVSRANAFLDGDFPNKIVEGILTSAFIMALQVTVTKIFFRSKLRSIDMMMRREIYQRISSFREIKDMLTGYDDHKEKIHDNRPKVHPARLFIPFLCHILLFIAQVCILVTSGQIADSGNMAMSDYKLVPLQELDVAFPTGEIDADNKACRQHLIGKRHTLLSGALQTCVRIQTDSERRDLPDAERYFDLKAVMKCYTNEFWFEIKSNKYVSDAYSNEGDSTYTKVFVDVSYRSHDGQTQTLLPFTTGPEEASEDNDRTPRFDSEPWDEQSIHYIYDQLALRLKLTEEDKLSRFGNIVNNTSHYTMTNAQYGIDSSADDVDDEGKAVAKALRDVLLYDFTLVKSNDVDLYSFDPLKGEYGKEKGRGPRLYNRNIVSQWIWAVCILALTLLSLVFLRINTEDPEFYLYRSFLEANAMDPKLGPLAQPIDKENDVFYFGRWKKNGTGGLFSRFRTFVDNYYQDKKDNFSTPASSPTSSAGSNKSPQEVTNYATTAAAAKTLIAKLTLSSSSSSSSDSKNESDAKKMKNKEKHKKHKKDNNNNHNDAMIPFFSSPSPKETKKQKEEEEILNMPMLCGVDLGCFKV